MSTYFQLSEIMPTLLTVGIIAVLLMLIGWFAHVLGKKKKEENIK